MDKYGIDEKVRELGHLMRAERKRRKLNLRFAAKQCDVPFGYLAAFERGEVARPKIHMLKTLSAMYGMSADEVILAARKIPTDVYWKVVYTPPLLDIIRNYPEK